MKNLNSCILSQEFDLTDDRTMSIMLAELRSLALEYSSSHGVFTRIEISTATKERERKTLVLSSPSYGHVWIFISFPFVVVFLNKLTLVDNFFIIN